jgi:Fe-S-cluster containining protein
VVPAGDFSEWLRLTEAALRSGQGDAEVPCGDCTACCRSSMFIHIRPVEKQTLRRIPRRLLFSAPGRAAGHLLMGYNEPGYCPMLAHDKCSIYPDRPQTCRRYDCRIFAATGIAVEPSQPDIAERVEAWAFSYRNEEGREEHRIVKEAAAFLVKNAGLFPPGALPKYPAQLAVLVIHIFRLFSGEPVMADAVRAEAILAQLNASELSSGKRHDPRT